MLMEHSVSPGILHWSAKILPAAALTAILMASQPGNAAAAVEPKSAAADAAVRQPSSVMQVAQAKAPKSTKQKPSAAEIQALADGIAEAQAGRYETAVTKLTAAIDSGRLPFKDTARALYWRGLAYNRAGKPAEAITDLTSAVWKKGALSPDERRAALSERAAAYQAAGLGEQSVAVAATPPATAPPLAPAVTTPRPKPVTPKAATTKNWDTRKVEHKEVATAPAPTTQTSVGSFFSGLFGSSAAKPAPTPVKPGGSNSQTSSWSTVTSSIKANPAPKTGERRPVQAAPAPAGASAGGKLSVQVAALRSRADAEALAKRLSARHPGLIAGRAANVKETVMGNMGTMYQVRVGPFRSQPETQKLCAMLLSEGLDCLLLDN
ncbi:MAG: hypothetical protein RLZ98_1188 [Pseudomonadota bacterium]|jgi:tetratricopeptide (TPR) repeat protein